MGPEGFVPSKANEWSAAVVFKIGGSLLDLPDLSQRVWATIRQYRVQRPLLVAGGGAPVDWLRHMDVCHHLGEETSHALAVAALSLTARLLAALLDKADVISTLEGCRHSWEKGAVPVIDPSPILGQAEMQDEPPLPHTWQVTSDSIAAWIARRVGARELVLLKSAPLDRPLTVDEAAQFGLVDEYFPQAAAGLARIRYVNLRDLHSPPQRLLPRR